VALAVALAAAGAAEAAPARRLPAPARGDARVEVDRAGRVRLAAREAPLARVLDRLRAATGLATPRLPPAVAGSPVTLVTGPAPLEQVVRRLLRPHGVALVFGPAGAGSRLLAVAVIPAGGRPAAPAAALAPLGEAASAEEDEVIRLGDSLDDPAAVARLEAIAADAASEEVRALARRVLEVRPGGEDEGEELQGDIEPVADPDGSG
jgi:hypothetical protein